MSLLMTHLKRHKKSLMALLRLYVAAASMTERNGCKPSQKVFELTILGVCNRYLKKMTADAGITKNVSFHTSRHTFAVLTLAAGSDLYTVGKLLGHTSINSTQVYADVVMETKVEAISRISNYFSNL